MYKKEVIGITGHSGILGKEISKKLKKNNYKLYYYKSDILNKKDLVSWILKYKFDIILHLAAKVPTRIADKNFNLVEKVNYLGTKNLVNAIKTMNKKIYFFLNQAPMYINFKKKKLVKKINILVFQSMGRLKLKQKSFC